MSVEELRRRLYVECGGDVACRRAADRYLALVQNPCFPPAEKLTPKVRKFYIKFVEEHGPPPRCDVEKLIEERLRGTALEKYIPEIVQLAERLRRGRGTTSRVAAATAAIIVAERHGLLIPRHILADHFGASYGAVLLRIKEARREAV